MDNKFDDLSLSRKPPLIFQSLEILQLSLMPNLKGWWKGVGSSSSDLGLAQPNFPSSFSFPKLLHLKIFRCPNMVSLPSCPDAEKVHLVGFNKELPVFKMLATSSKLRKLRIDTVEDLLSMPKQCLHQLSLLHVWNSKLVNTNELGELFATLSSSLRTLKFTLCQSLESISKGLEHLTALEELTLYDCTELDLSLNELRQEDQELELSTSKQTNDEDGRNGMPWKAFNTSLHSLRLRDIPKLVSLPSELQYLANLHTLEISRMGLRDLPEWINRFSSLEYLELIECEELESLPEGFHKLISLQFLQIESCTKLTKRCRGPNGEDWPKIQHVPQVIILDPDYTQRPNEY